MKTWVARRLATRGQLLALSSRVAKLEAELRESQRANRRLTAIIDDADLPEAKRLNRRLAEIIDVVQEVLVPAANRDDERLRRLLDEYSKRL